MLEKELMVLFLKERKQEKKDKVATQDCNMSADMFLRHTAVILKRRSSSRPCGMRLESPNLSEALLNLAASGRARLHTAADVKTECMHCSC